MDNGKDTSLLMKLTKIRKKPQQPLTDFTDLYSRIANESIYYLKLEEKREYKKAVQGWKALNTHTLYELTKIEHTFPKSQSYTKDEISIQNGIRELYHKSLQHLERVAKLCENEQLGEERRSQTDSFRRPAPPSSTTRPMLKTLRPLRMNYHRMHTASAPNISNTTSSSLGSRSGGQKINFTHSKPLTPKNVFADFSEEKNLIDLSDGEENAVSLEKSGHQASLDFDVQEYFDTYLDNEDEDSKSVESLHTLGGLQKTMGAVTLGLAEPEKTPEVSLKQTRSSPNLPSKKTTTSTTPCHRPSKPNSSRLAESKAFIGKESPSAIHSNTLSSVPKTAASHVLKPVRQAKTRPSPGKSSSNVNEAGKKKVPSGVSSKSLKQGSKIEAKPGNAKIDIQVKNPQAKPTPKPTPKQVLAVKKSFNKATDVSEKSSITSSEEHPSTLSPKEHENLKEALEDDIIEQLRGVDKTAAKQIFAEIVVHGDEVHWEDIAGLESAKNSLKEAVVYPFLRPDLFLGLREPVRGMLLFGPPGTGKTMLARAVATESKSTFFSISASSLTSKYLGESEKLVRALFAIAKKLSPSIIFVDEIDSIMGSRSNESENESSRRIKNEFLVQWSSLSAAAAGYQSGDDDSDDQRVLVLAATNLPWQIDEAARRRFVRRQYIPLPESETRKTQLVKLMMHQTHTLEDEDFKALLELTEGYSGSDITSLAKDAAMGPLRELGDKLLFTPRDQIRPISLIDFKNSLNYIKPSVSKDGLEQYENWALEFGSSGV
ncbi:LAMI_0G12596g1_1 [Lachancea mirantina]|uniref:LAMI_0G12596g1_1 n=1 Tax=Lachancea mirantina TaxID=1230905 RepID=A0A1G4KBN2_9SACH|nr:LAMI_0G12596g1_1 [Lachancea mirantina]